MGNNNAKKCNGGGPLQFAIINIQIVNCILIQLNDLCVPRVLKELEARHN